MHDVMFALSVRIQRAGHLLSHCDYTWRANRPTAARYQLCQRETEQVPTLISNCIDVPTGTVATTNWLDWHVLTRKARFRLEIERQNQSTSSSLESPARPQNTTPASYVGCNLDGREPPLTQEDGDFIGLAVADLEGD